MKLPARRSRFRGSFSLPKTKRVRNHLPKADPSHVDLQSSTTVQLRPNTILMIRIPEPYVYVITERTFDHHEDEDGNLWILSVHATAALANDAVKEYLHERCNLEEDEEFELVNDSDTQITVTDGLYEVTVDVREDELFSFTIKAEKMELEGGFPDVSSSKGGDEDGKKGLQNKRRAETTPSGGSKKPPRDVIVLD